MSIEHLHRAVDLLGGQAATARVIGQAIGRNLKQAHVWIWLNSPNPDQTPPAEYCPAIERATSGQVRCEDLRPDVDWAVLRCRCPDDATPAERGPSPNELQEAA